ncbi:MAG TPA: hypothetical protein VG844_00575 [Terracidiphilus sp.]|nr:hypothetical protein [Terracidiphilus sp.]
MTFRALTHVALAVLLSLTAFTPLLRAQSPAPPPVFSALDPIVLSDSGPVLRAATDTEKPFTVAGEKGVLVGRQSGTFEAWVLPVKLLSHLTIEANIQGYRVPIDVNRQAASIEVRPGRTTITYSHIGFTVRQIMFSPDKASPLTGPVVLFQFDCVRPTDFTFRFTPNLEWMWPERNEGHPGIEWVSPSHNDEYAPGGYYVIHGDYPDLAGAVTIPGARPGILAPYQERPQFHPAELLLHIDPATDQQKLFPLLMAVGTNPELATNISLGNALQQENQTLAVTYAAHLASYQKLLANATTIETPDKSLDQAFQWSVISIEQLRAKLADKTALVAGYYESGDSARPGFGWFFGRDALYTLYAVNGFGDFALSRSELEFLIARQRADGKIMHEYSQTAPAVDWQQFPYQYAAADSTPLFLLAVEDYVRSSGDVDFLRTHRDAIEKAWAFETGPAHDTDHDGIYDNSQGTGWVESWPSGMPHQEIYLALLDQQASAAMAQIERLLGSNDKSATAQARAETIAKTINAEYADKEKGCYAFSYNGPGKVDRTTTVYPALAWWSNIPGTASPGGKGSILTQPDGCLSNLISASLDTDWGLRDVASNEKFYDGMSYHQGSVWPLFTGWAALAEYRANQPLAGYQLLMQNANLTRAQDLGSHTELLSGDFFVPFGRSTSHQLWSSAMVITPTLRGLFGISVDASTNSIILDPHLPAGWGHALVRNIVVGKEKADLSFTRTAGSIKAQLIQQQHGSIRLRKPNFCYRPGDAMCMLDRDTLTFSRQSVEIAPAFTGPEPGDRTKGFRVISARYNTNRSGLTLDLEGLGGTEAQLPLVSEVAMEKLHANGATINSGSKESSNKPFLQVHFPPGTGYQTITVTLTW